ncbi:uncharacterized protein DUF2188 [Saccharopolyspora erythraea NRRL 2338]|uniref:Uncharacterized protein n=2 Tax=Saccharopolyspora erythraea TaxID=1836 RepID=A4FL24_SACEN|nr:DUF2188 domain-containing protein [Saccharopolyspora erythraea]EQD81923.1 hypothetical protein N599_33525 [Saccharopolyspora erythraea D]PFG98389.1 uncharacterized protein DUF2188 [Saccharopolyspora erythraea NRRL 2338]QRK88459.1 DUF2188 domain-containing protein [Saccharopolyspora erythraea]CAM04749.1 hypothetical protein SACE_5563 [Saccharopolyspora erythraea NRRL 2338]
MGERHVRPSDDAEGGWVVTGPDPGSSEHRTTTQGGAVDYARDRLLADGGGKLFVHGTDGVVREERSVGEGGGS